MNAFYTLLAAATIGAYFLCVGRAILSRHKWQTQYCEAGSNIPYRTETFFSQASLQAAVAVYVRLGNDDTIKITGPGFPS
jgi:hypothetical protein